MSESNEKPEENVAVEELPDIRDDEQIEQMEIPSRVPVLPLRDTVIYPFMVSPLFVARKKSIKLVDDVLLGDRIVGLVTQKDGEIEEPGPDEMYNFGTVATVLKMLKFPDGSIRILVQGLSRMEVESWDKSEPYLTAHIKPVEDKIEKSLEMDALAKNITIQFQKIVTLVPNLPDELQIAVMNISHPGKLADLVASNLNLSLPEKQSVLERVDVRGRLEELTVYLNRETEVLEVGSKIQHEVQSELGKNQREYYLRQQLEAIKRELGEGDERTLEIQELRQKIAKARMSKEANEIATRELERLAKMAPGAAEYTVSRTYLDWLISLPWSKKTKDNLDIHRAKDILDKDHFDLEKVKDRILEYLAVQKLKSDKKGPIICFVGPPGVGKTSLGRSIARALGREFVRLSLGGVRDEAEIRGHRRTYIGALPGRIIQGIRQAGSKNPVFMLDEIDKLGMDFRGDPSSALLEVLDPEQNDTFSDHYLETSFDLSRVMFIATANVLDPIPSALKDRMEVLELPGYTEEEKLQIAKTYILPKQIKSHGLTQRQLIFEDKAVLQIIRQYTREAGLRNLERMVAGVCRRVARGIVEEKFEQFRVRAKDLLEFLGPPRFIHEVAERLGEPGVVTGLSWTPSGGDILFIEATKMRGKGGLILTGQLGDVMKESARAALSYIQSRSDSLGIPPDFFQSFELHVHVPAGAIPKDGPSAGAAIATALLSLILDIPVRNNVAMTGEITLRGKVLPIGGLKEKILAAKRAGIKTVLVPFRNKGDMIDVPGTARKGLKFKFVETLQDVFELAIQREIKREEETSKISPMVEPVENN